MNKRFIIGSVGLIAIVWGTLMSVAYISPSSLVATPKPTTPRIKTPIPTDIPAADEIATPTPTSNAIVKGATMEAFDINKTYTAILTTSKGVITIALNAKVTPKTAKNFIDLSRKGFYNNTIFHRVIAGFMIQGGDPKGDGTGGPGYTFPDEPFVGSYTRGTVAMANAGPNTNGSQFFIMHADYPLPKNYVIFGKVTDGIEVVDTIAESPVKTSASGENSDPVEPTKVTSVEIQEK